MKTRSVVTRSVRRVHRTSSPPSTAQHPIASAVQIFLFRADTFFGTELFDGVEPILVGRHHRAQLRLDGDTVSRRHCRLVYEDGEILIEDLGSSNGTYLNRLRVQGRRVVHPTDAIHIGAYTLKVRALHASPRRTELAYTEVTTRVEAVLSVAGTNSEGQEASLDLALGVHEKLYREAVRRATDGVTPLDPLPPAEAGGTELSAHDTAPVTGTDRDDAISEDVRVPVSLSKPTPRAATRRSKTPIDALDPARLDPEVEARLRDLDDLIAALDAKEKGPRERSRVAKKVVEGFVPPAPLPPVDSKATTSSADQPAEALVMSQPLDAAVLARIKGMDTGEFARDLASRLALDGRVVPAHDSSVTEPDQKPKSRPVTTTTNLKRPLTVVPTQPQDGAARPQPPPLPKRALTSSSPPPLPPPTTDSDVSEETPTERQEDRPLPISRPRIQRRPSRFEAVLVTPSSTAAGNALQDSESYDDVWTHASMTPEDREALEAKMARQAAAALPKGADPEGARVVRMPARSEPSKAVPLARVEPLKPEPSRAIPVLPARPDPSRPVPVPPRPFEASRMVVLPAKPEAPRTVPPPPPRAEPSRAVPMPRPEPTRAAVLPPRPEPTRSTAAPIPAAKTGSEDPRRMSASVLAPRAQISADESATERQDADAAYFEAVEVSARHQGRLIDVAVLRQEGEQYVLGHRTPQGAIAPAAIHAGLRLLRVNPGRTVDLVFPKDVAGHLVRGKETVMFNELTEGRKYSCLRLEGRDVATIILGQGGQAISYHIRFLRRPLVAPRVATVARPTTRA